MQHAPAQQEHNPQNLELSLREHLLAASGSGHQGNPSPYPNPPQPGDHPHHPYQHSDSASPHDPHAQLDPNVAHHQQHQAPYAHMSGGEPAGDEGDLSPGQSGKAGKRELSTSKRAAQNRAAQRAFRQRKEGYIKKLEEQVKDFQNMEQNFRSLQNENYQLREYILNLQSRLLETHSDIPPAPSHVNLSASSASQPGPSAADTADGHGGAAENPQQHRREMPPPGEQGHDYHAMSQLQAAAAQAEAAGPHPMHTQHSQQQQSHGPYGLGMPTEYPPAKRPRTEEEGAQGRVDDAKSGQ
ncbi:hypothetical protein KC367_g870 [Hortaea werneckii]|nr:hypothetical protein KC342_g4771 [Hortaea werneckii]KAI7101656.1 hypothetical protein KC339_g6590 [Hortaea werneckii]KAI7242996.1 hypothetical protein KC365_g2659 [Hortaea werneckii]KAI7329611.1 hypothetical protein KC340_g4566 [Hortaea werneckii]KAI7337784.1 hypothetical protein KC315_g2113 [Hortaea werneckii]